LFYGWWDWRFLWISPKSWGVKNSLLCEKNIFHGDFKGFI